MSNQAKTKSQEIQERRDARKEQLEKLEDEQAAIDLELLDALEIEFGDSNVSVIKVPFTPGSVTRVATRTPKPEEIARYRHRVKPKKIGEMPNTTEGAAELAALTRIYPKRDADGDAAWSLILAQRPGLDTQLGQAAVKLALGSEEEQGKD